MADLTGRKVFKVFNQEFIVDERYNVNKELGQGAYGIVWYVLAYSNVRGHAGSGIGILYLWTKRAVSRVPEAILSRRVFRGIARCCSTTNCVLTLGSL